VVVVGLADYKYQIVAFSLVWLLGLHVVKDSHALRNETDNIHLVVVVVVGLELCQQSPCTALMASITWA